ncbi:hypothetical protein ACNO7T_15765 [Vibrio campbellii]
MKQLKNKDLQQTFEDAKSKQRLISSVHEGFLNAWMRSGLQLEEFKSSPEGSVIYAKCKELLGDTFNYEEILEEELNAYETGYLQGAGLV